MASSAYSVHELAEKLGVSTGAIYRDLNETGEVLGVPGYRVRSRWLVPRRLIDQKLGEEQVAS